MVGLFTLIWGAVFGVSAINDAVHNHQCKKTVYRHTSDGKPVSFTKDGRDYINGEPCRSIPYKDSKYGMTCYKTVGKYTNTVYEDTRNNLDAKWEREARKSYEENKAKGKLGYLKLNPRLHYCLLTEMSTGKQIAELSRYSKDTCYKEYLNPNGCFCNSGDGNKIKISNEEYEGLSGIGGMHTNYDALGHYWK